ncbi:DMT family transporter [Dongia sp.]|uniref:DMT family transporter n=1 Tax=Dongia sp. TaxID=1977262 RepID=UPI0035B3DC3F
MTSSDHKSSGLPNPVLPDPVMAALLALGACLFFALLSASVKQLSGEMHGFAIAFWRNLFGFVFMIPWLWRHGLGSLRTGRFGTYLFRSSLSVVSMMCGFTALAYMPIANATSLSFTAPLFATILAALILKENVRLRRWSATLLGFSGVLIVLQPGSTGIGLGEILVISSAFLSATVSVIVKTLSRSESSQAIVTYMVLLSTPLALIPALFHWTWPSLAAWPYVIALGLFGTLGHLCWTRAFAMADASAIMPYDYSRLIFVTGIGMFWFGEQPNHWFWLGSAVIVAAGLYIAQREAFLRRHKATAAAATQASAESAQPGIMPVERIGKDK